MKLPAQKGNLRISNADRAVQPTYLYDPEKDDGDLHCDHMVLEPPRNSSMWGPRPYSLAEIIYEYDTEDVVINVTHRITYTRIIRTHYTNF